MTIFVVYRFFGQRHTDIYPVNKLTVLRLTTHARCANKRSGLSHYPFASVALGFELGQCMRSPTWICL